MPLARSYPRLARCCVRAARVACSFVLVCEFPEAFTAVFEDDDGDIDEVARAFFLAEAPGTAAADIDDDERSFAIRSAPCLCGIGVPPDGRSSIIAAATSSSVVADEDARAFVEPLR